MTKSFDNMELLARIEVQLRHMQRSRYQEDILQFKDIILDLNTYQVTVNKQIINLSKKEFEILKLMLAHPQRVYTKSMLYELVIALAKANNIELIFTNMITDLNIDLEHLFDHFYTSDMVRTSKNTGLGLTIVKELLELHNGQIKPKIIT